MSIEKDLGRIATALERIADGLDSAVKHAVSGEPAASAPAKQLEAKPAAEKKPTAEKKGEEKPAAEAKPAEKAKGPEIEDVRKALRAYSKLEGLEEAQKLLTTFGVEKVSDLKADQYQAVIDKCNGVAK